MPVSGNDMTGNANYKLVTLRFIDARGDKTASSIKLPATATVANIATLRTVVGAVTNANLYEVQVTDVYGGIPSASVAVDDVYTSVQANVNILFKNLTTLDSLPFSFPAPIGALILDGESVDVEDIGFLNITDAVEALLGALAWEPVSARFTERREINVATPI